MKIRLINPTREMHTLLSDNNSKAIAVPGTASERNYQDVDADYLQGFSRTLKSKVKNYGFTLKAGEGATWIDATVDEVLIVETE